MIPFHAGDIERAGQLLDWVYRLNGRKAIGNVLLAATSDIHQEEIEKLKISSEMAFTNSGAIKVAAKSKEQMLMLIAAHVSVACRMPWFWCEPDFTPIRRDWIKQLEKSYYGQPMRYCGSQMKAGSTIYPCRCIVYPQDADREFNVNGASQIIDKMTKTRLVREFPVVSAQDCVNVDSNVIAVHPDKQGIAIASFEEGLSKKD